MTIDKYFSLFAGDVFTRKINTNVTDVNLDPRYIPSLELKGGSRTKCLVCSPIVNDGICSGVIVAINKIAKNRSPRDFSTLSFSPNETLLLGFIGTNIALALKHSTLSQSMSATPLETSNSLGVQFSRQMTTRFESDPHFQKLVELLHVYGKIDAERVSIFLYSPVSKSLVCVVSQDIKGFAMPCDKGLAGLSFTAVRTINIPDARTDERHYKDVDKSVGFTTRSVLCSPIVTSDGVPLGVIQAINKKSGPAFSIVDEQQIQEICNTIVALLTAERETPIAAADLTSFVEQSKASLVSGCNNGQSNFLAGAASTLLKGKSLVSSELAKGLAQIAQASSLVDLAAATERVILSSSSFDFVRLYVVNHDRLCRIAVSHESTTLEGLEGNDEHLIAALPPPIKQAVQGSSPCELKNFPTSDLFGDTKLFHAFVVPLQGKLFPFVPGNCVGVLGNRSRSLSEDAVNDEMDLVITMISSALHNLSQRLAIEESTRQLKNQYYILNNTLGSLQDFVIILDGEGKLLGCNKAVEDLLGLNQLSWETLVISESKKRSSFSGRSSPTPAVDPNTGMIREGMHYSQWLTNGNSPELCRDIQNALLRGESRSLEAARLTSSKYPEGISVDYQVTAICNPEHGCSKSPSSPSVFSSQRHENHIKGALPHIPEVESNGIPINNGLIVVVTLHINKRKIIELDEAVPSVNGAGDNTKSTLELKSASSGVDSAASILAAIRNNYILDEESEMQIKQLTNSLVQASRRMSIQQSSFSAINLAIQAASMMLVNPMINLPEDVFEWTFDVLTIKDSLVLCNIIGKFFDTLFNLDRLQVDSATLARYIAEVGRHYHDRPFHNLQHAACVTHFCFMLIRATACVENLKEHQVFAILLSAVVHDVDHPGNTNLFEINSGSELAIRYNDQSVLENHHCSTAFRLMRKPHMQVLASMSKNIATEIRKTIIQCVMATDMAVHFELIDETKKRAINGWNFEEVKDQALLGKILLHAADLSNPVRPFHMTREWAGRISIEFNDQVEREQALGMPVLGFMMTPDEKAFCKNETGFASFVVAPMWRTLALCFPDLTFLVRQLDDNLVTWKALLEKLIAEETSQQQQELSDSSRVDGSSQK